LLVPLIRNLFETTPELRVLREEVRHLLAIESELRSSIPGTLKAGIASIVHGRLLILTPDNAAASKLRQLLPRLLRTVQQSAPDITSIEVRVQVTECPKPLPHKQKYMTPQARAAFETLAARLPPSSLQRAVVRIAGPSHRSEHQQESFKNEKS
jgi:hypothetical protein